MPFCIRCAPFDCADEGLISVSWSTRPNFRILEKECEDSYFGSSSTGDVTIPGPALGSVNVTAYAFDGNREDRWANTRCQGQASASQSTITKYNAINDKYVLIPSKQNTGQIAGDVGDFVTLDTKCTTTTVNSTIVNGATITTVLETYLGDSLSYTGHPMPVSFGTSNFNTGYTVFGFSNCFLSNFNFNVDFPNTPATVTYGFTFLLDCDGGGGPSLPGGNTGR